MKKINTKKAKSISELSNNELNHYAEVATDSILLMDALFDDSDIMVNISKENIINYAKELTKEIRKRSYHH